MRVAFFFIIGVCFVEDALHDSLEKLIQQRQSGAITEEEFSAAKAELLERSSSVEREYSSEIRSSCNREWPAENDYLGWIALPLRRYADFSGRSRRKEYWLFLLMACVILATVVILGATMGAVGADSQGPDSSFLLFYLVIWSALFIPGLAVAVRRLHDQDKSGWFLLLNFVPYLGGLVVLILMSLDGTSGRNRFGEDPKGR